MKRKHCRPTEHEDRPLRRGSSRVVCTKCGDVFPCHHTCGHVDCRLAKGETMPEGIAIHIDTTPEALDPVPLTPMQETP